MDKKYTILDKFIDVDNLTIVCVINEVSTLHGVESSSPRKICKITLSEWDCGIYEKLDSLVAERESEWVDYSEDALIEMNRKPKSLVELKREKSAHIKSACAQSIASGFISTALGRPILYPNNDRDQTNLSSALQRSMSASAGTYLIMCQESGVWDYRSHTKAELQKVSDDSYDAILKARVKNLALQNQIEAAITKGELALIVW